MSLPTQNPDLSPLIELVHHRWSIPIIAELYDRSGAKFITLINRLGVSITTLRASHKHRRVRGFVEKNTGHGHPMRPEYLLTNRGLAIGKDCLSLVRAVQRSNETDLAFRKWTLPLVAAIGEHSQHFNELRSTLREATPRAIAIGLKSLLQQQWVDRTLFDEYPPTAGYELMPRGMQILTSLDGLYRHN